MKRTLSMTILSGMPALVDQNGLPVMTGLKAGIPEENCFSEGEWTLTGTAEAGEVSCGNTRIEYRREGEGMALRTFYTYTGKTIKACGRYFAIQGMWNCGFARCLYNSLINANGVYVNEMQCRIYTVHLLDSQRIIGTENMALVDSEGNHAVVGCLTYKLRFPCVEMVSDGRIGIWMQNEGHPVAEGETLESDWMYIGMCDDVRWGLIDYGKLVGKYMDSRAGIFETSSGYCTWYYYYSGLKPQNVYDNLKTLNENRDRFDVKYFNLDDGWYKYWGDWTENEKFSCGMKKIADDIRSAGYLPGIWLAPFGGKIDTDLYREHPDWFVRQANGSDIFKNGNLVCLDMSHPEVKQFIYDTFHRISHEWGYRHVKIDIITNTIAAGRHYDPSYTSLMNYREGLRIMREAMTEDTVLLACTAPFGPSIGLADAIRTSNDIAGKWDNLPDVFSQSLKRYYYNKTVYDTDPDCLLVRNKENEDEECGRQCLRTDAENRTFATALMACGGSMIMSDKLPLLHEYQLDLLSKMFPINTQTAIPLDLMDSEIPGVLDLGRRGSTHIFALINWTDVQKTMKLDIGAGHIFEFWSQQYMGYGAGLTQFEIEPHGARLLFVTDDAPIAAIGVDDCLCPTIEQRYEDGKLTVRFLKKGETICVLSNLPIHTDSNCIIENICERTGLYAVKQTGEDLTVTLFAQ